jgi:hypothetical protein
MSARKDDYEKLWSEVLDALHASGELKGDMHLTRLLLLGAANWSTQWYNPRGGASPQQIADQLAALVLSQKSR